jgi:DnaJ-class molecular chaperone
MRKKIYKIKMKYGDPYKICQNCKGNGYVRIIPYSETQTCKECMGAGHFENEKRTTNQDPVVDTQYVLKLIKLLEEFVKRGSKTTIH